MEAALLLPHRRADMEQRGAVTDVDEVADDPLHYSASWRTSFRPPWSAS
jgi:hypothetical protein